MRLEKPDQGTLLALSNWFRTIIPPRDSSVDLLGDEEDMVLLFVADYSRLTLLVHKAFGYILRNRQHPNFSPQGPVFYFPSKPMAQIVSVMSIMLSVCRLVSAIATLYFSNGIGTKLGLLSVFTIVCAGTVGLLTNARNVEIYGAAAAYVFPSKKCAMVI